jgi:hypothetical protein
MQYVMLNSLNGIARGKDDRVIIIDAPTAEAARRRYVSWAWSQGGLGAARRAALWRAEPVYALFHRSTL